MLSGMSFNYGDVTGSVIDYSESSGGNKVECEKLKTNPCFCSFFDRKSCTIRIFRLIFRVLKWQKDQKKCPNHESNARDLWDRSTLPSQIVALMFAGQLGIHHQSQ